MSNSAPVKRKGGLLTFKRKPKLEKPQKKRGRGERAGIDREVVVQAGLRLLSRVGADGFTSRRLARELGVHAGSVLTKFEGGFGGVRAAMAGAILKDLVPDLPPEENPPEYVRTLFRNALEQLGGKGALAQLAAIALAERLCALALLEGLLIALRGAKIPEDGIPLVLDRVLGRLAGMLLIESSPAAATDLGIEQAPEEEFPVLSSLAAVLSKGREAMHPAARADRHSADIAMLFACEGKTAAE